jgi:hypothetical protein
MSTTKKKKTTTPPARAERSAMAERRGETFVMQEGAAAAGPISFSTFILGLASTTLIHLGEAPDPTSGERAVSLELARQSLDLLDLLERKTKGNLNGDEERLFQSLLTDLRLKFVALSRK